MENSNYNSNYNQNYYQNTNPGYNQGRMPNKNRKNNNTTLIIVVAILAAVAIIASCFMLVFTANMVNESKDEPEKTQTVEPQKSQDTEPDASPTEDAEDESPAPMKKTPTPVGRTMYVDCNVSLTLREGPGTNYAKRLDIPTGSPVYVIEYEDNGFAKVTYNNAEGYVMRDYLSDSRPYVWDYDEATVEGFVEDVLYGYVNAINTKDFSYLSRYLSGGALTEASKTHQNITSVVDREEIISVRCHSVKRISKTQVTVVRNSTIRVYKKDGTVKDAVETYITTVENTGSGMYVTSFEAA